MSTKHNLFEEKGEPKRYRTEVLLSAYQSNALPLGQTRSQDERKRVALIFNCGHWDPRRSGEHMDMGEGRGGVLRVVPPVIAKHTVDWYNQFRRAPSACDCNVHVFDTEVIQSHLPLWIFRCAEK